MFSDCIGVACVKGLGRCPQYLIGCVVCGHARPKMITDYKSVDCVSDLGHVHNDLCVTYRTGCVVWDTPQAKKMTFYVCTSVDCVAVLGHVHNIK